MANPNLVNVATINAGNLGFNLSNTLTATLLTVGSDVVLKINRITLRIYEIQLESNEILYSEIN